MHGQRAPAGTPKTWDEWTDAVGNVYRPGDLVAVAVVSGRSPVLRFGRVVRINRVNTKGQLIQEHDRVRIVDDNDGTEQLVWVHKDWCSVTVMPMFYGRGFRAYGKTVKAQTYQFPGNVVKLDATNFDLEQEI